MLELEETGVTAHCSVYRVFSPSPVSSSARHPWRAQSTVRHPSPVLCSVRHTRVEIIQSIMTFSHSQSSFRDA
jgi:hypothetical protein